MRLGAWLGFAASLTLVAGCAPLVDSAVPQTVRDVIHTLDEPRVRTDIEELGTSTEIHDVLMQLAHDLIDAAAGAGTDEQVQSALRAILHAAIDQIRADIGDVDLDPVLTRAERMVHDVVADAIQQVRASVRGAVDGRAIEQWVHGLVQHVLHDVVALIDDALGNDSAERSGRWLRTAFGELMRDVDVDTRTEQLARAAAHGAGAGIGDALDHELGGAMDRFAQNIAHHISDALHDAAGPWREVAYGLVVFAVLFLCGTILFAWLLYHTRTVLHRTQQDHDRTIIELQHGARHGQLANEVLSAVRGRDVTLHKETDPPLPPKS